MLLWVVKPKFHLWIELAEYMAPEYIAENIVEPQGNSSSENNGTLPDRSDRMGNYAHTDDQPEKRRERGQIPPVATHCGTLPAGSALEDFHQPPFPRTRAQRRRSILA